MAKYISHLKYCTAADMIRKVILSWLAATTAEYILIPFEMKDLHGLDGLTHMSLLRVFILTVVLLAVFLFINKPHLERWLIAAIYSILAVISVAASFSWPFLAVSVLVLLALINYCTQGWNRTRIKSATIQKSIRSFPFTAAVLAVIFFLFVSIWTVCRVYSFSTPTYDFGIFSQMFYNMKSTGLPMTTVERDGLLSHFHVHLSPIYYLLLPVYCLFPYPATLQVLQAAVLASAIIPLWKIGRHHGLSPALTAILCSLLLLYPAYSGGASYDIHENAFLTPLILWLLYFFSKRHMLMAYLFGVLVLMVKEDAAVYVAVIALYFLLHGLLYKEHWEIKNGIGLLLISVAWFIIVTGYLANVGDGVMTYRYQNFMYDNSGSLITVIKAVLMCPMKAVFECVDPEKLNFIALTLLPVAALPLCTRRYELYILLIPYVLINLMSDYRYQHDIFFQYTYGSTACLFYMCTVIITDFNTDFKRFIVLISAVCISIACFITYVVPKAVSYPTRYWKYSSHYEDIRDTLSMIPDDASVSATTFYTTQLSQRSVLYDIQYASTEHILSTEYIVLSCNGGNSYKKYATDNDDGFGNLCLLLQDNGYSLFAELNDTLVIYRKTA